MTSVIVCVDTLFEEGYKLGLDPISSQNLGDEVYIFGGVDSLFEVGIGEVGDEFGCLFYILFGSFSFHGY